MSATITLTDI